MCVSTPSLRGRIKYHIDIYIHSSLSEQWEVVVKSQIPLYRWLRATGPPLPISPSPSPRQLRTPCQMRRVVISPQVTRRALDILSKVSSQQTNILGTFLRCSRLISANFLDPSPRTTSSHLPPQYEWSPPQNSSAYPSTSQHMPVSGHPPPDFPMPQGRVYPGAPTLPTSPASHAYASAPPPTIYKSTVRAPITRAPTIHEPIHTPTTLAPTIYESTARAPTYAPTTHLGSPPVSPRVSNTHLGPPPVSTRAHTTHLNPPSPRVSNTHLGPPPVTPRAHTTHLNPPSPRVPNTHVLPSVSPRAHTAHLNPPSPRVSNTHLLPSVSPRAHTTHLNPPSLRVHGGVITPLPGLPHDTQVSPGPSSYASQAPSMSQPRSHSGTSGAAQIPTNRQRYRACVPTTY